MNGYDVRKLRQTPELQPENIVASIRFLCKDLTLADEYLYEVSVVSIPTVTY